MQVAFIIKKKLILIVSVYNLLFVYLQSAQCVYIRIMHIKKQQSNSLWGSNHSI